MHLPSLPLLPTDWSDEQKILPFIKSELECDHHTDKIRSITTSWDEILTILAETNYRDDLLLDFMDRIKDSEYYQRALHQKIRSTRSWINLFISRIYFHRLIWKVKKHTDDSRFALSIQRTDFISSRFKRLISP